MSALCHGDPVAVQARDSAAVKIVDDLAIPDSSEGHPADLYPEVEHVVPLLSSVTLRPLKAMAEDLEGDLLNLEMGGSHKPPGAVYTEMRLLLKRIRSLPDIVLVPKESLTPRQAMSLYPLIEDQADFEEQDTKD
jgi:hypothetical protein